jgi:hypothetical protein
MSDPSRYTEYRPEQYPEWQRWKGEGDPPKRWWAINPKTGERTLIYRSYADYLES